MEKPQEKNIAKLGAYATLLGSVCMLTGAALLEASGANLDRSIYKGDMAGYLKTALSVQNMLIANLSFWITGVIVLGVGANMMALLSKQKTVLTQLIRYNYGLAVSIVVVSYMAWLAVVVRLASSASPEAAAIAEVVGWFGVHTDWLGTVLVLEIGPVLITAAGKGVWVPNWLRIWSYIAFFTGLLCTVAQYAGGLTSYGFLIIPVGMGWMIAAAVTLLRRSSITV